MTDVTANAQTLWTGGPLPPSAEVPPLRGHRVHVIKPYQPEVDGGRWLLGVALAWQRDRLYASYGFNPARKENTATEEARCQISDDGGATWGPMHTIDAGDDHLGVSHGVLLEHAGRLWSFHGAFHDDFQRTHTRAYLLDDATGQWQRLGVVIDAGFWPLQQPVPMADGNWIMAGLRACKGLGLEGDWPAVAISHGADFTKWDLVVIAPQPGLGKLWGESTVIVQGAQVVNLARWGEQARLLMSLSRDFGRSWTAATPTNLNHNTSKPCAGTLSTGQHYLIGATTADCVKQRDILTIALGDPGAVGFNRVFAIRRAVCPEGPGTSNPRALLSYPYALEHDGQLFVGYADKREPSAELAVIPLSSLA